jgi:hypothetical protein
MSKVRILEERVLPEVLNLEIGNSPDAHQDLYASRLVYVSALLQIPAGHVHAKKRTHASHYFRRHLRVPDPRLKNTREWQVK